MSYQSKFSGAEVDSLLEKVQKGEAGGKVTVDSSLSTTSENPVMNKAITSELNKKATKEELTELSAETSQKISALSEGWVKGVSLSEFYTDGKTCYAATARFKGLLLYLPPMALSIKVRSSAGLRDMAWCGFTTSPSVGSVADVTVRKDRYDDLFVFSVQDNTEGVYVLSTIDTIQEGFDKDNVYVESDVVTEARISKLEKDADNYALKGFLYNGGAYGFMADGMAYLGGNTLSAAVGNYDGILLYAEAFTKHFAVGGLTYEENGEVKSAANAILFFAEKPIVGQTTHIGFAKTTIVDSDVCFDVVDNGNNGVYIYISLNKTKVNIGAIVAKSGVAQDVKIKETNKRIDKLNPFKDKVIVNFGDSIIGNPRGTNPDVDNPISNLLAERLEAVCYNAGFGGCQMATHQSEAWDAFSMHSLADSISSGNWSVQDNAIASYNQTFINAGVTYFAQTLEMLKGIDWQKVDYITISYGTNDFAVNVPLDGASTKPYDNYCGALEYSVEKILTTYPHIRVIATTPIWRFWTAEGVDSDEKTNSNNNKLTDFVGGVINVCNKVHIPYIDLYNIGFCKLTQGFYFSASDGTHPNQKGRNLMADRICGQLRSLY